MDARAAGVLLVFGYVLRDWRTRDAAAGLAADPAPVGSSDAEKSLSWSVGMLLFVLCVRAHVHAQP